VNHGSFCIQISRLEKVWPKVYGEERVKMLWDEAQHMPEEVFTAGVTAAIRGCKSAPLQAELMEIIQAQRRENQAPYSGKIYSKARWQSEQAPGTPAYIEALFLMLDRGEQDTGPFRTGLRMTKVTGDQIFRWYESWTHGQVHPELARRAQGPAFPEF